MRVRFPVEQGNYNPSPMQTKPLVSRTKAYLKMRQKSVRDAMRELKLNGLLLTHPARSGLPH